MDIIEIVDLIFTWGNKNTNILKKNFNKKLGSKPTFYIPKIKIQMGFLPAVQAIRYII